MLEPLHGAAHWLGFEPAIDRATLLLAHHQTGIAQDVDVLQHAGQRHREGAGQLADGQLPALRQALDDVPPRGVGQRQERRIEIGFILNHLVIY